MQKATWGFDVGLIKLLLVLLPAATAWSHASAETRAPVTVYDMTQYTIVPTTLLDYCANDFNPDDLEASKNHEPLTSFFRKSSTADEWGDDLYDRDAWNQNFDFLELNLPYSENSCTYDFFATVGEGPDRRAISRTVDACLLSEGTGTNDVVILSDRIVLVSESLCKSAQLRPKPAPQEVGLAIEDLTSEHLTIALAIHSEKPTSFEEIGDNLLDESEWRDGYFGRYTSMNYLADTCRIYFVATLGGGPRGTDGIIQPFDLCEKAGEESIIVSVADNGLTVYWESNQQYRVALMDQDASEPFVDLTPKRKPSPARRGLAWIEDGIILPATGEPGKGTPRCGNVYAETTADKIVDAVGAGLDLAAEGSVGFPVASLGLENRTARTWLKSRLGINGGKSACATLCTAVPKDDLFGWAVYASDHLKDEWLKKAGREFGIGQARLDSVTMASTNKLTLVCANVKHWKHDRKRRFVLRTYYYD